MYAGVPQRRLSTPRHRCEFRACGRFATTVPPLSSTSCFLFLIGFHRRRTYRLSSAALSLSLDTPTPIKKNIYIDTCVGRLTPAYEYTYLPTQVDSSPPRSYCCIRTASAALALLTPPLSSTETLHRLLCDAWGPSFFIGNGAVDPHAGVLYTAVAWR